MTSLLRRLFLPISVLALLSSTPLPGLAAPADTGAVFVSVAEAEKMLEQGAIVLDARGDSAKGPYLPRARVIDWKSMRYGAGPMGRLDDDHAQVQKVLQRAGVVPNKVILVYGAMSAGYGEEGRIWWTLRYLGLGPARILDGGIRAWVKDGKKTIAQPEAPVDAGSVQSAAFQVQPKLRADWRVVDGARKAGKTSILDSRSVEEWNGAVLFGEARGGRIPGAKHFEWRTLIGPNDRLLDRETALQRLKAAGLVADQPVITYCTGGVRSAFVQAALLHYGFEDVANYDGSWFDWSGRPKLPAERPPRP